MPHTTYRLLRPVEYRIHASSLSFSSVISSLSYNVTLTQCQARSAPGGHEPRCHLIISRREDLTCWLGMNGVKEAGNNVSLLLSLLLWGHWYESIGSILSGALGCDAPKAREKAGARISGSLQHTDVKQHLEHILVAVWEKSRKIWWVWRFPS